MGLDKLKSAFSNIEKFGTTPEKSTIEPNSKNPMKEKTTQGTNEFVQTDLASMQLPELNKFILFMF